MLSTIQRAKLDQLFCVYAGNDKVITHESFKKYIERIRREFSWSTAESIYLTFHDQLMGQWYWWCWYADNDQDGKIDREEFHAFVETEILSSRNYSILTRMASQWFMVLDRDEDGKLNVADYQIFLNVGGYGYVNAAIVLAQLDKDGDGYLSEQEMKEAYREFWTSSDVLAKGNYLFGQTLPE